MRMSSFFGAAAVAVAIISVAAPASAQTNVLVMDEARIIRESTVGQHIAGQLDTIRQEIDNELQAMGAPLQAENDALTAETSALNTEAIQQRPDLMQRIQAFQENTQRYAQMRELRQREFVATERQALGPVVEVMQEILQQIVTERGADILLDRSAVVYANERIDISPAVIERLNQRMTTSTVTRVRAPAQNSGQ